MLTNMSFSSNRSLIGISVVAGSGVVVVAIGIISYYKLRCFKKLFQYQPDKVWKFKPQGGTWGKVNRPTAGALTSKTLPRGEHPLQLYSIGTPNGVKVTCLLEELNLIYGIEYDAWPIGIGSDTLAQFTTGFVEVNPNSKIPALLHYDDNTRTRHQPPPSSSTTTLSTNHVNHINHNHQQPSSSVTATTNGHHVNNNHNHNNHHQPTLEQPPIRVFESAAILIYLCERFDTKHLFLPSVKEDPQRYAECISWVLWTQGSAPYLGGGYGHFFSYAPVKIKYAIDRYTMEVKRQLDVLERHLGGIVIEEYNERRSPYAGGPYLCGNQITIADFCCFPWYGLLVLQKLYPGSGDYLQVQDYKHVLQWTHLVFDRLGVQRGCIVNPFFGPNTGGLWERHHSSDFDQVELPNWLK